MTLQERLFGELAGASGISIDLAYRRRSKDEGGASWARENIELVRGDRLGIVTQIIWALRACWLLLTTARRYSHIHLHGAYWMNLFPALLVPRSTHLLILPVLQNGDLRTSGKRSSAAKRLLLQRVVRRAHRIYALSDGIRAEALALGAKDRRVVRIANPVSDDFRVERVAPPVEDFPLLFCGKLGPVKQPHLVVETVRALRKAGVPARAIFVGPFVDAGYEKEFIAATEGITEWITLLGYVPETSPVYGQPLAAFVLPSKAEGLPGALAEAMFAGLPSVVTDVGAMGEIVRRSGGGVVIAGLGEMVERLREIAAEPGKWAEMSQAARQYAHDEFSVRAVAAAYRAGLA
ncbi:glycosyltransferase family 4 protein [Microbacterium sp. NPDC077663]|uniref:glycosyltransferase family 4 protein n=1 Tax=Microbacterium sp. NPDC077663 TaxID=3364189 RepID=UPI0037C83620